MSHIGGWAGETMGFNAAAVGSDFKRLATDNLRDATKFLFFDEDENVLCSSFQVEQVEQELTSLKGAFDKGRETSLRTGVRIQNQRFEVHQYDPPLIYGRAMMGDPERSEAFAVYRIENGISGKPIYGVITFALPNLTARLVPMLVTFCNENIRRRQQ